MSLEQKIENLTAAVNSLTEAVQLICDGSKPSNPLAEKVQDQEPEKAEKPAAKTAKAKSKKVAQDSDEDSAQDSDEVSEDEVRELAKKAIANGMNKRDVKSLINEIGCDSIANLDADQRIELAKKLKDKA